MISCSANFWHRSKKIVICSFYQWFVRFFVKHTDNEFLFYWMNRKISERHDLGLHHFIFAIKIHYNQMYRNVLKKNSTLCSCNGMRKSQDQYCNHIYSKRINYGCSIIFIRNNKMKNWKLKYLPPLLFLPQSTQQFFHFAFDQFAPFFVPIW